MLCQCGSGWPGSVAQQLGTLLCRSLGPANSQTLTSAHAALVLAESARNELAQPSQRGAKIHSKSLSTCRERKAGSSRCTALRTCSARSSVTEEMARPGPGTESRSLVPNG